MSYSLKQLLIIWFLKVTFLAIPLLREMSPVSLHAETACASVLIDSECAGDSQSEFNELVCCNFTGSGIPTGSYTDAYRLFCSSLSLWSATTRFLPVTLTNLPPPGLV